MDYKVRVDIFIFWIDKMPSYFDAYTMGAPSKITCQKFTDCVNLSLPDDLAHAKRVLYNGEDDVVLLYDEFKW